VALIRALAAIKDLKGANEDQNHGIADRQARDGSAAARDRHQLR
jgi:hypothetical protein